MFGAQQRWVRLPSGVGEPLLYRIGQDVVGVDFGGEFSGEDGAVSTDGAGNIDSRFFRLAIAAMVSSDDFARDVEVSV